jgi:hypothetical protein
MALRLAALAAVLAAAGMLPAAAADAGTGKPTAAKAGKKAGRSAGPCRDSDRRGQPARRSARARAARCAVLRRPRRLAAGAPLERLIEVRPGPTQEPAPGPVQPPAPAPDTPALSRFVSVAAREFSLTLSRPLVGTGAVTVELRNVGEDPHNLVVSPEGTHTPLASFSELDPGIYERRSVTLAPGRYLLWCSLEFHEGLGMSTTLRVQ